MFFKKQKKFISPNPELFDSVVGEGMEVHGRIVAHKSIRIDGTVHGSIEWAGDNPEVTVAIGNHGRVFGDINGHRILVGGSVEGNIYASERVELHGVAHVVGDITYADIGIEPGAEVLGLLIKRSAKKNNIDQ
jgi:cytoskeletal protein CcmA (bactofilin family)